MSWFSRRAPLLGVVAFALVWAGGALFLLGDAGLTTSPLDVSTAPFSPGTITPGQPGEEDCGDVELPSLARDAFGDRSDEFECLLDALDRGTDAVLVVRSFTDEDQPIRVQFRVDDKDTLVIHYDDTRDPSGDGSVTRYECTGIDSDTYEPTGCDTTPLEP